MEGVITMGLFGNSKRMVGLKGKHIPPRKLVKGRGAIVPRGYHKQQARLAARARTAGKTWW